MSVTIYIINLPGQDLRRQFMELQLSVLSERFRFEFVDAVNGKMLSENQLRTDYEPAFSMKAFGRELNRGELGCAMSHRDVYRRMIERKEPAAVVLEDDVGVGNCFPEIAEALVKRLDPEKSRIVLLTESFLPSFWKTPLIGKHKIVRTRWAQLACGYIVTQAAAKALVDAQTPVRWAADWWMEMEKNNIIETWGVLPACIFPCLFDRATGIGGNRGVGRLSYMTRVRRKLRSLWFQMTSWEAF